MSAAEFLRAYQHGARKLRHAVRRGHFRATYNATVETDVDLWVQPDHGAIRYQWDNPAGGGVTGAASFLTRAGFELRRQATDDSAPWLVESAGPGRHYADSAWISFQSYGGGHLYSTHRIFGRDLQVALHEDSCAIEASCKRGTMIEASSKWR